MNPDARRIAHAVTLTGSVIGLCAFTFSFGNIWHLALAWGIPAPIAPLVAPMLDVSVVGLMVAIRQLALLGIPARRLLSARLLMLACAATTWGLNIAQSLIDHRWGAVIIDSVAPALLLGWAEVGPTLLRLTTTATTPSAEASIALEPRVVPLSIRSPTAPIFLSAPVDDIADEGDLPHVA